MSRHTLIIGGGAIGSATACFLSEMAAPGERVTVIERDPTYQRASSSLSCSSIRQQFSTPINVQLSQFGWEFMRTCVDDSGKPGGAVGLNALGYLFLGRADQAAALRDRADRNRSLGVAIAELSHAQLRARWPWMHCDDIAYAAMGTAGEGWFDGYMLQQLYRSRARSRGVAYVHGEVVDMQARGVNVVAAILADGSRIEADRIVDAAGPWSKAVARQAGVQLPVHARRRTIFVVSCPTPIVDCPILIDTSGAFLRPEQHHFLVTVAPADERDHDDLPLDPDFTPFDDVAWPALAQRIPAFEALRVERAWAGYYEFNAVDQNGLVGQVGPDNFFVATGFSGHGLMHSAGIGRGVAELLTHGAYQTLDLSPLSPARLQSGRLIVEDAVY